MAGDHGIPNLAVWTHWNDRGDFVIEGQHLGAGAIVGREDYEYFVTVAAADLDALATALGVDARAGSNRAAIDAAWSEQSGGIIREGESRWLAAHGVPAQVYVA